MYYDILGLQEAAFMGRFIVDAGNRFIINRFLEDTDSRVKTRKNYDKVEEKHADIGTLTAFVLAITGCR